MSQKITFTLKKPAGVIKQQPTLQAAQGTHAGTKRPYSQITPSPPLPGTNRIAIRPPLPPQSVLPAPRPSIFQEDEEESTQTNGVGTTQSVQLPTDDVVQTDSKASNDLPGQDLDALVGSMIKEAGIENYSAAAQFSSKVITLNELLTKQPTAADSVPEAHDDLEDDEYHQKFIEALKRDMTRQSKRAKSKSGATDGNEATANAEVHEEGFPPSNATAVGDMDYEDEISYDTAARQSGGDDAKASAAASRVNVEEDEEDTLYKGEEWTGGSGKTALEILNEKLSRKDLKPVDHKTVEYLPWRKCLYIPSKEVASLTNEQVASLRDDAEIKVRGKQIPHPITRWEQAGLPDRVLSILEKEFAAPFAIQQQALPVIMSGRDVIAVARTGSGKTLSYLLPALRQVLDQPPLREGDGPIVLILAPSRELVTQIYREARKFTKHLTDVRVTAIYGGASTGEQIAELKRGASIVVATPGRLIDLLTLNAGRVMSLQRVCYVVLDEADRMFDMGFEPQIAKVIANIRPDRQTVLFSATFPVHVETLARKVLRNPVEIVVGGRSKASADIDQFVEIHEESDKFPRLLQLLGEWYERGSILIFVDTKEHCDMLYADLMKLGYPAVSLHGGKDQIDRDQSIADFKNKVANILIATSVAGRGLDVKDLVLVINYSCPNHLEDYVHRVGRTGRAGRKGTAYTFISSQEGVYAADLIRALKDAKQPHKVHAGLQSLADDYAKKVAAGEAKKKSSGYHTRGYKFDENELSAAQAAKEAQRKLFELEAGIKDVSDILAEEEEKRRDKEAQAEFEEENNTNAAIAADEAGEETPSLDKKPTPAPVSAADAEKLTQLRARLAAVSAAAAAGLAKQTDVEAAQAALAAAELAASNAPKDARAAAFAVAQLVHHQLGIDETALLQRFVEELEVNDYPPRARARILRRENLAQVQESTGTAIIVKGVYVEPGKRVPPNERKLYVLVEGPNEGMVRKARNDLRRGLEEETLRVSLTIDKGGSGAGYSKFTV